MKKNIFIAFLVIVFNMICLSSVFAQMNPDLIKDLNDLLVWDIKLMQQCEYSSDTFDIAIPYTKIINEQQQSIEELAGIIDSLGTDITDERMEIQRLKRNFQALNADAELQIQIIEKIDKLLSRYGHPKVQAYLKKAKDQAYRHFMLLSNACQKIIIENRVEDVLDIKQP